MVAPAIREILKKYPKVWFYVINSGLKHYAVNKKTDFILSDCPNVYYSDRTAPISLYPRFMSHFNFDIGIAPLEDCNFNRAKSNLRWLEYSALKIPTVATKISHFEQTITDGKDGLLIPNNDLGLWREKLEYLINDESARKQIGNAAYKTVKTSFNVRKNASTYLKYLKDISGYGLGIPDDGGLDDADGAICFDRGSIERRESRPIHYVAD